MLTEERTATTPSTLTATPAPKNQTRLAIAVIGLAAILPFFPALNSYFIGDDFGLIQLFVHRPPWHFLTLFTSPWTEHIYNQNGTDELRPLVALSYQIDALWNPASPTAFHITNVVLHVLNTFVVFAIARRVAKLSLPTATFAAVIFAVLPTHAETVAWISGRADSIPGLFYLSSFLAYAIWRQTKSTGSYVAAVALCFLALFSKQSGITILGTLVAYDVLVARRPPMPSVRSLAPYVPFAMLTIGYLALRYWLFGNSVREDQITSEAIEEWGNRQATYLQMALIGLHADTKDLYSKLALGGLAVVSLPLLWETWRSYRGGRSTMLGQLAYFGPAWWLISVTPLIVTYLSARHLYVASAGIAIVFGVLLQSLSNVRWRVVRYAAVLAVPLLILGYTVVLERTVAEWNKASVISHSVVEGTTLAAMTTPPGTLLVVGTPPIGSDPAYFTWISSFSLPFSMQPPFSQGDITTRVPMVTRQWVYCCPIEQWYPATQRVIATWASTGACPPAVVMAWSSQDGALTQYSNNEDPQLCARVARLAQPIGAYGLVDGIEDLLKGPKR